MMTKPLPEHAVPSAVITEVTAGLLNRDVDMSIHVLDLWNLNSSPDGR